MLAGNHAARQGGTGKERPFRRLYIVVGILCVAVVLIVWKYSAIMLTGKPTTNSTTASHAAGERGIILDRNGRILAASTTQNSVTAWMPNVQNLDEVAADLAPILDESASSIHDLLAPHSGFVYVKRMINQSQSDRINALLADGKLKGISLEPAFARMYPEGDLAGHVVGYVNTDNVGLDGIEYSMNDWLAADGSKHPGSRFGDQVFLTLDMNIQYIAHAEAKKVFDETDADTVILLVMDAKTGEFLAYVSFPEFNPNSFASYPDAIRADRPLQYIYEPGSVLKIFTISSFLQLGGITPKTEIYDDGVYTKTLPNGTVIRIKGLAPHGYEDPRRIIKYSSNVGAAYSSDTVSDQDFYSMLRDFGFGMPTGIDLPGETSGILRPTDQWTPRSKPTIAFGQEIGVSAVQIVTAATALTNDGVLLAPHIVHSIAAPDGTVLKTFPRKPVRSVISPTVAHEMLSFMLSGTDPDGFARRAKVDGIETSAKTGTSNIYDPKTGGYSATAYVASTIAILPTNDPQLIVYGVVINPKKGPIYGSAVAAPLVGRVSDRTAAYLGIPRSTDKIATHSATVEVPASHPLVVGDTVPDLMGLSKRELLPLLENPNLKVIIDGSGWVVSQDPAPGTKITDGMTVNIKLQ